jgi:hypothetical protein
MLLYRKRKGGDAVKKGRLVVTIDEKLLERLIQGARDDNRNLSNYVETLLYRIFEKEDE